MKRVEKTSTTLWAGRNCCGS